MSHQVFPSWRDELLLENINYIHRGHDVCDMAVNFKACRLMARRLANYDCLNEVTNDRHQPALGLFVCVVARQEDQLADRIQIPFQTLPKIFPVSR